jgi:hypothetical protein
MQQTLIFAYNADDTWRDQLVGTVQKMFNPSGYDCQLCSLTHSLIGGKKEWESWKTNHPELDWVFLHKTEAQQSFPDITLPFIMLQNGAEQDLILSGPDFSQFSDLKGLLGFLDGRLSL